MKARKVNESLEDILKPKTEGEIDQLSPNEMLAGAVQLDDIELINKAIKRGASLMWYKNRELTIPDFTEFVILKKIKVVTTGSKAEKIGPWIDKWYFIEVDPYGYEISSLKSISDFKSKYKIIDQYLVDKIQRTIRNGNAIIQYNEN